MAIKYPDSIYAGSMAGLEPAMYPDVNNKGYTIKLWVYIQALLGWAGSGRIFDFWFGDPVWSSDLHEFAWDQWRLAIGGNVTEHSDPSPIRKWQCWMYRRNSSGLEFYIDGKYIQTRTGALQAADLYQVYFLSLDEAGASSAGHAGIFGGYLCIWERELSISEIIAESQVVAPLSRRKLWCQVNLDQKFQSVTNAIFPDLSGNHHHFYLQSTTAKPVYTVTAPVPRISSSHLYLPQFSQKVRPIADIRTGNWTPTE